MVGELLRSGIVTPAWASLLSRSRIWFSSGPAGMDSAYGSPEFRVQRGERVFLQGASGSGKSTLLGLLGGVLVPQPCLLRVLDTDLTALSSSARDRFRVDHLGFLFQQFNLVPYLSVRETYSCPAGFRCSGETGRLKWPVPARQVPMEPTCS